jgi:transposase
MTRDEIQAVYDAGPEAVIALVAGLLQRIDELTARVTELERQGKRNSRNSSQPPSQDGFQKPPKSLRPKSERPVGGQPGHRGATLRLREQPDQVETHPVTHCAGCGQDLQSQPATHYERRQVFELPVLAFTVTEHRSEYKTCDHCQTRTQAPFPAAVTNVVQYGPRAQAVAVYLRDYQLLPQARTSELFADLFGHRLSPGTLGTTQQTCAAALTEVEARIKAGVQAAPVAHFDETGLYVAGKRQWLHVASTPHLTHYATHPKRGAAATTEIGLLPAFHGIAVHDAWAPYWQADCLHAWCNAHHLRELQALVEQGGQAWAQAMQDLLRELKRTVEAAQVAGAEGLDAATHEAFFARYQALLTAGLAHNPAAAAIPGQRGRRKQSKARNLLLRLQQHPAEVLRFLTDFRVPFDNNLAERDLRMMKVQQKISGCFRAVTGAQAFCRIRSYISTVRKHGINVLSALEQVFTGTPFLPDLRAG